MSIDPSKLLTFCRAVEEGAEAGLMLFGREELLATIEELEALKRDVDRALLQLSCVTAVTVH